MTVPCPVCGSDKPPKDWKWVRTCRACGFKSADLAVRINDADVSIDEGTRETSLAALRDQNFRNIIAHLKQHAPAGARLLDIGCGHGWFIRMAREAGFEVTGVEPDRSVLDHVGAADLDIRVGFFPQAIEGRPPFDIIIFNDVFEHIPDVAKLSADVSRFLKPSGLLVLNIPVTDGLYYRAGEAFAAMGMVSPMERLWQLPFASPHVSYFSHKTLNTLLTRQKFNAVETFDLKTVSFDGLWARIALSRRGVLYNTAAYMASCGLIALSGLFPSDAYCVIARKHA